MPYPYVTNAAIKNNKIELSVAVNPADAGTYVEVSGTASQTGGAFANFYDIQQVPTAPNDPDNSAGTDHYVFVSAHPLPPNKFMEDQDVTTVIRVGKVWLTVLGKDPNKTQPATSDGPAAEGPKWGVVKKVSEITDDSSNTPASS